MVLVAVLCRRYCCAVGAAAVRRAMDDEVPDAVEETGDEERKRA